MSDAINALKSYSLWFENELTREMFFLRCDQAEAEIFDLKRLNSDLICEMQGQLLKKDRDIADLKTQLIERDDNIAELMLCRDKEVEQLESAIAKDEVEVGSNKTLELQEEVIAMLRSDVLDMCHLLWGEGYDKTAKGWKKVKGELTRDQFVEWLTSQSHRFEEYRIYDKIKVRAYKIYDSNEWEFEGATYAEVKAKMERKIEMTTTIDKLREFRILCQNEVSKQNFLSLCDQEEAEMQQMKDNYTGQYIEMRKYRKEVADLKKLNSDLICEMQGQLLKKDNEIAELKNKVEAMRNCGNCANAGELFESLPSTICTECDNINNWKLKG